MDRSREGNGHRRSHHAPGSYNWTRGAAENSEDLNLISSPTVAAAYSAHWRQRLAVSVRFARRED